MRWAIVGVLEGEAFEVELEDGLADAVVPGSVPAKVAASVGVPPTATVLTWA